MVEAVAVPTGVDAPLSAADDLPRGLRVVRPGTASDAAPASERGFASLDPAAASGCRIGAMGVGVAFALRGI